MTNRSDTSGASAAGSEASGLVSRLGGNKNLWKQYESAVVEIERDPANTRHQSTAVEMTRLAAGIKAVRAFRPALQGLSRDEALQKLKALIEAQKVQVQRQKEAILGSVLAQVKPLEATWRGLEMAYKNSIGEGSKSAKFFLVNASKDTLQREFDIAPTVKSPDERKRMPLVEHLLRDKGDRFGGNPYCLVILPAAIEAEDVDFYRGLGKIGRRYRCPIVGTFGASLAMQEAGKLPVAGDQILGGLKDQKNQAWKRLIDAPTPEEAEELSYLCLILPSIAARRPYVFQRDLPSSRATDDALHRDASVWVSPAYAFAGKIESLGKDYSVHLMPAGKLYGRIGLAPALKPANERFAAIQATEAGLQYPLESDLYRSNANAFWANGLITVVKWMDTGAINIYGDATLLTSPDTIKSGEVMKSLGVRLVHDHILHYCNRYLYELVGAPVDENLRLKTETDLKNFLRQNTGQAIDRPLEDYSVAVEKSGDELLAVIEIQVKESLRKVTVRLRVRRAKDDAPGHVEEVSQSQ